jgi:hypothetical protein
MICGRRFRGDLTMDRGQTVLVSCSIEKGAFSGERVFHLTLADGSEYFGVAPAHYCFKDPETAVSRDEPAEGASIPGFVEAILISNGGDKAMVELPDGEAVQVEASQIPFRQKRKETRYVPL